MVNYFMRVAKINWLMFVQYSKDLQFPNALALAYAKGIATFKKTRYSQEERFLGYKGFKEELRRDSGQQKPAGPGAPIQQLYI